MAQEHPDLFELFESIKRSAEQAALAGGPNASSISIDTFFNGLSGLAVRQITNSRGETYPSDFGVGLPPLA